MSYFPTSPNWFQQVAAGRVPGYKLIDKWGRNTTVGTVIEPIVSETLAGSFWAPTNAASIRIKAGGDVLDTADGTGARKINVQGLDQNYEIASEDIVTNGALASASTAITFIRVFRAFVVETGTYRGANADEILIENTAGTADIITVDAHAGGQGQSLHCQYSAPVNTKVYLIHLFYNTDTSKLNDVHLRVTDDISVVSAPFGSTRTMVEFEGVQDSLSFVPVSPILLNKPGIETPSDIWVAGSVTSSTSLITARMQLLIESTDGAF